MFAKNDSGRCSWKPSPSRPIRTWTLAIVAGPTEMMRICPTCGGPARERNQRNRPRSSPRQKSQAFAVDRRYLRSTPSPPLCPPSAPSEMLVFCPNCGMLLQLEPARDGRISRLSCPICPYIYPIRRKIVEKIRLPPRKEVNVEPIFSEEDRRKMFAKNDSVNCPKCHGSGAYFHEMQIRSADEPSTIFYMCCNESCKAQWRED